MIDLQNMTLEQLKQQKLEWWQLAIENGSIAACSIVCRELGEALSTRYGPKYVYVEGDLKIYVDDYEHFSLVLSGDKIVMSTHPSDQLFIPGDWFDTVKYRAVYALYKKNQRETEMGSTQRKELLQQLCV